MARNLLRGGHAVAGFDLHAAALEQHVAHGGSAAVSAAEAARGAEVVFTMLPTGTDVHRALFAAGGAAEGMAPGTLVIDMSTVHPRESDAIRSELAELMIAMVDAPVGRTSAHAHTGELLVMVGGEPGDLERARPLLALLGDPIVDCGGPGTGARLKIVNNFLSIGLNVLTAEALTLAESSGLSVPLAIDVMSGTAAGQGHMATTYPNKALAGDLSPAFMLALAAKDLRLALAWGEDLESPLDLGRAALATYQEALDADRGGLDWTAIYPFLRERAGLD
jgi:4-hydroxybutyrate dehydrogenase/sulfolactaldehyde 3-reductase